MIARLICSFACIGMIVISGCATKDVFMPRSEYPPDPWVKGYADKDDCLGGEKLAAMNFVLPDYPRRSFNSGRQGWVIMRLDVNTAGQTENVTVERSVPEGLFEKASRQAVEAWTFAPPADGALQNCRVLLRFRAGKVSLGG
ncbi:energy transducer TonB [Litorimonas sp. RW-G-Af-16]|uniref:energy transducer TonB n=1 Tax=Litorimonas sp. RW-G-Af-16 TaxID=3241168 RepID=UPI00390CCBC7